MFSISTELSAAEGGIILILLLLIISAAVFTIKFALDIALNKKLTHSFFDTELPPAEKQSKGKTLYAFKSEGNEPAKKRTQTRKQPQPYYTVIPEDKLFVLQSHDKD